MSAGLCLAVAGSAEPALYYVLPMVLGRRLWNQSQRADQPWLSRVALFNPPKAASIVLDLDREGRGVVQVLFQFF